MDAASETGPPGKDKGGYHTARILKAKDETNAGIITHTAEQVKPNIEFDSRRLEALRQLAAFRPLQDWRRRRLQLKGAKP